MRSIKKIGTFGKIILTSILLIMGLCLIRFTLPLNSENVQNREPELYINAHNLISKLELNTSESIGLASEKVVAVTGMIREINNRNNRITIILGSGDKEHPSIICDMTDGQKDYIKHLSANDTIMIKGIYKGFLKDAIFLNCIVIHE
ncbi:OB-fold protein [Flagellimonas sp. 2504JD1-5]